jgi:hypothetical protein
MPCDYLKNILPKGRAQGLNIVTLRELQQEMATLDEYLKGIRNGQDLIDAKVIPKTSSSHLALLCALRLAALREKMNSSITDESLGTWMPAFSSEYANVGEEVSNPALIQKYAAVGMKVKAVPASSSTLPKGLEGTIRIIDNSARLGVEWSKYFQGGHNLSGNLQNNNGCFMTPNEVTLLVPEGKIFDGVRLTKGVVADEKLGHKVRFTAEYKGQAQTTEKDRVSITVPADSIGVIFEYDAKSRYVGISFDKKIEGTGRNNFRFKADGLCDKLAASSLGQMLPQDREKTVYEAVLSAFFPNTILETPRTERVIAGLFSCMDPIYYGPPGSGKSNLVKDIISIAKQQEVIFTVEGCKVQCNPFSLFDSSFAKLVPPCPECMMKYSPRFRETGMFTPPRPKDVKVVVANYGDGKGIEHIHGTVAIWPQHLSGFKVPRLDGTTSEAMESAYDPEGFQPGVLLRTNNGLLGFDELDKLPEKTLDGILSTLNDHMVKPDQLRFSYPANSLILATANEHTRFSPALNDRATLLAIRRPEDPEVWDKIGRVAYYGERDELESVPLPNTHPMQPFSLKDEVIMPTPLRMALNALFIKFDKEYTGTGKNDVMCSTRSLKDAFDISRAQLYLHQPFFKNAPKIITPDYAMFGVQFAFCTRLQVENRVEDQAAKNAMIAWIKNEYPPLLKQEEDTWWCKLWKHIAIYNTQVSQLEGNARKEVSSYREDVRNARASFDKITQARAPKASNLERSARIEYPIMDYLFRHQSRMALVCDKQLDALVNYYLEAEKNSSCRIK